MAAMSRNDSATSLSGFTVYQPELGAPLQFLPALGTQQLDDLINAFLPGPAVIQEKRAAVSIDFFDYARTTGNNIKYYQVSLVSALDSVSSSPSSSMQDSGYGSSFNASPAVSTWSWGTQPVSATASPATQSMSQFSGRRVSSASSSASRSRTATTDFTDLPGMKIMTRDGRDVTNSASRGCKTKEQRDHAHLMRIMKACDACRRKKIRCDPSHKRGLTPRSADQQASRQAKPAPPPPRIPPPHHAPAPAPESQYTAASLMELDASSALDLEFFAFDSAEPHPWDDFLVFDDEPLLNNNVIPNDYDFFSDPDGHLASPVSSASISSTSPVQPVTPPSHGLAPPGGLTEDLKSLGDEIVNPPVLPYLDRSGPAHHYVDFNLYSPASSFADEDLLPSHDISETRPAQYNQLDASSLDFSTSHSEVRSQSRSTDSSNGQRVPSDFGAIDLDQSYHEPGGQAILDVPLDVDPGLGGDNGNLAYLREREFFRELSVSADQETLSPTSSQLRSASHGGYHSRSQTIVSSLATSSAPAASASVDSRRSLVRLESRYPRAELATTDAQQLVTPAASHSVVLQRIPVGSSTEQSSPISRRILQHGESFDAAVSRQSARAASRCVSSTSLTVHHSPSPSLVVNPSVVLRQTVNPRQSSHSMPSLNVLDAGSNGTVSSSRQSPNIERDVRAVTSISGTALAAPSVESIVWSSLAVSVLAVTLRDLSNGVGLLSKHGQCSQSFTRFTSVLFLAVLAIFVAGIPSDAFRLDKMETGGLGRSTPTDEVIAHLSIISVMVLSCLAYSSVWLTSPSSSGKEGTSTTGFMSRLLPRAVASNLVGGLQLKFQQFAGRVSDIRCRMLRRLRPSSGTRRSSVRVPGALESGSGHARG